MCVATDCFVLLHASVKVAFDTREHPTDRDFMFIQFKMKKPMDTLAVFVKPRVPAASRLGLHLTRYLSESQSINAWETLFLHLNATFE
jgi:hypothetical protein